MRKTFLTILIIISIFLFSACGQTKAEDKNLEASLSISCDTILKNTDSLSDEKKDIIPKDGVVLSSEKIYFSEGDSLLDILKQELKSRKIHIDFEENTSVGSAYVKGIANIYSGDCGELSGWMIRINGEDLTVGCGDYFPRNNDKIEWLYTCDMGNDL